MTETLDTRVRNGFARAFGGAPEWIARAPGRVNLMGEHTDYNGGFVLPCAIGLETWVAVRARADGLIRAAALDFGSETDAFEVAAAIDHAPGGGWRDYVRGMVLMIVRHGVEVGGADLVVAANIPLGAGLSSSASLEVSVGLALLAASGSTLERPLLARLGQAAENEFVGCRCGIMDQLASAAAGKGAALLIDCATFAVRHVPIPDNTRVLVVQSGIVHEHVGSGYNDRRAECEAAAMALGVSRLRDVDPATLARARGRLPDLLFRRARHIVSDSERARAGADALAAGDLAAMGRLMRAKATHRCATISRSRCPRSTDLPMC